MAAFYRLSPSRSNHVVKILGYRKTFIWRIVWAETVKQVLMKFVQNNLAISVSRVKGYFGQTS